VTHLAQILPFRSTPTDRIRMTVRDTVDRMAAALVTYEATAGEADAIRCLFGRGFPIDAIAAHAGEALVEAQRIVVMRGMRH